SPPTLLEVDLRIAVALVGPDDIDRVSRCRGDAGVHRVFQRIAGAVGQALVGAPGLPAIAGALGVDLVLAAPAVEPHDVDVAAGDGEGGPHRKAGSFSEAGVRTPGQPSVERALVVDLPREGPGLVPLLELAEEGFQVMRVAAAPHPVRRR